MLGDTRGSASRYHAAARPPAPWTRREKRTVSSVARDRCPSRSPAPAARGAAVRAPVPEARRASWFPRRERQTPSACSVFILLHVRQGRVPVPKTGGRGTLAMRPHTHRALNGSSVSRGTGGGSVPTDRQFTVLGNRPSHVERHVAHSTEVPVRLRTLVSKSLLIKLSPGAGAGPPHAHSPGSIQTPRLFLWGASGSRRGRKGSRTEGPARRPRCRGREQKERASPDSRRCLR